MNYLITATLIIAIIISGCTSNNRDIDIKETVSSDAGISESILGTKVSDPVQSFSVLAEKSQTMPNGKYEYEVILAVTQAGLLEGVPVGTITMPASIYSYDGNMKKTIIFVGRTRESYVIEGISYDCEYESDGVECKEDLGMFDIFTTMMYVPLFRENIERIEPEFTGTKKYAGQECYEFTIEINADEVSAMTDGDTGLFSDGTLHYSVCFDKEHGFIASSKVDHIREGEVAATMGMELLGIDSQGSTAKDVQFPIDIELTSACNQESIDIIVHANNDISGEYGIKLVPYYASTGEMINLPATKTMLLNLKAGDNETVNVKLDEKQYQSSTFTTLVCDTEDNCKRSDCFYDHISVYESCEDSDGGINKDEKGTVTAFKDRDETLTDSCGYGDASFLNEWYCDGIEPTFERITCICEDGKCIADRCLDRDGGKEYDVQGECKYIQEIGRRSYSNSLEDSCDNNILIEYYCSDRDNCEWERVDCKTEFGEEYVCNDGKCVNNIET